jgi:hypothetical protein
MVINTSVFFVAYSCMGSNCSSAILILGSAFLEGCAEVCTVVLGHPDLVTLQLFSALELGI